LPEFSDLIHAPDTVYDAPPMRFFLAIALTVSVSMTAGAQRNGFKVRYLGGTDQTKTDKEDWNNNLTVLSDEIRLDLKDGRKVSFDPRSVTAISYGRAATRHVTIIVTSLIQCPILPALPAGHFELPHEPYQHGRRR
jgi:hypothetical protein